jgi:crossover junction endodeoxyribonuclease RuvC
MAKDNSKILAIDPGTRKMGIALLERGKLIYHGVRVFKDSSKSPSERLKEARKTILRLIRDFRPGILAAEKAFFANNKNAALLNVLVDEIKAIARRKKLRLISYAPSTIKKYICGNGHASKKEVAKVVVAKYPELKVYLTQDRAWKEKFHQNMFDAVALGMTVMKYERDSWRK